MVFLRDQTNWPTLVAAAVALLLYLGFRRSRYFGNTAPLLMVFGIAFLETTQVLSAPWLWALPFLFTFVGGVFADVLETKQRKLFLATAGLVVVTQALVCWSVLPALAQR